MKSALAVAIKWAAFAVVAPALFGAGGFLLYVLCTNGAPNFWNEWSLGRFLFAATELLLGLMLVGMGMSWWNKLPKAAWLQRPISAFFRHG